MRSAGEHYAGSPRYEANDCVVTGVNTRSLNYRLARELVGLPNPLGKSD